MKKKMTNLLFIMMIVRSFKIDGLPTQLYLQIYNVLSVIS